jgi:ABC-type uncharacterized transport system ATPase subunit
MENPIVEIFGPTLLKTPVTITTNITIRTVPSPSVDYPDPTLADCAITVLDDAITYNGWVLQVADGARVDISNILLRAGTALTIGLDVLVKDKIRSAIKELNKKYNITVILTTHDMKDIEELCNRIIIIDKGKILYDGSLANIKYRFGNTKTVYIPGNVELDEVALHEKFDKVSVERGDDRYAIKFSQDDVNLDDFLLYVINTYHIKDFKIEDISIEDITKKLYEKH